MDFLGGPSLVEPQECEAVMAKEAAERAEEEQAASSESPRSRRALALTVTI